MKANLTQVMPEPSPRHQVVGLTITACGYDQFIGQVIDAARHRESGYACFANAHMIVEAARNPTFGQAVNRSTWTLADGVPLTWALRWLYGIRQERITGLDVLPTLFREADRHQLAVYIYGSTSEVLAMCNRYCLHHHPTLRIVGMYSPPFRPLSPAEEAQVTTQISLSGAQLVFVALGCPRQEAWMASLSGRIPAVLLGIGGALPVTVGLHKRAPRWMQQSALEWVYRFMQEPRRLFARYALTNTLFLYYLAQQWYRQQRPLPADPAELTDSYL